METLKTGSFALWYLFNMGNIYNEGPERLTDALDAATLQLFAGIPYAYCCGPPAPENYCRDVPKTLFPVACGHLGTHIAP